MSALAADRAVGMAAARSEIVGAYHDRAAVDLAPSADVVGRREAGDASIFVIIGETRETADLAKAAGIEEQIDSLPAGQLAARRADGPRPDPSNRVRSGRCAICLQCLHVGEQRRPGVVAIAARRGCVAVALDGRDRGDDLAGRDVGADLGWPEFGHNAGAGGGDRGFHFHRADDHQRRAGLDRGAGFHREFDNRARHRGFRRPLRRSARSAPLRCAWVPQPSPRLPPRSRGRLLFE